MRTANETLLCELNPSLWRPMLEREKAEYFARGGRLLRYNSNGTVTESVLNPVTGQMVAIDNRPYDKDKEAARAREFHAKMRAAA